MTPKGAPTRIVHAPFERFEIRIARVVVIAKELDPVAVRIPQIEKEGIADAMASWPALDRCTLTSRRHDVARSQDALRVAHEKGQMMEPWSVAVGEGDIMNRGLTIHPRCPQSRVRRIGHGEFGAAEAQLSIHLIGLGYVGREKVYVVDSQSLRTPVQVESSQQTFDVLDLEKELESEAKLIFNSKRPRLANFRVLYPSRATTERLTVTFELVEVGAIPDSERNM